MPKNLGLDTRPPQPFCGPLAVILDFAGVARSERVPPSPLGWYWSKLKGSFLGSSLTTASQPWNWHLSRQPLSWRHLSWWHLFYLQNLCSSPACYLSILTSITLWACHSLTPPFRYASFYFLLINFDFLLGGGCYCQAQPLSSLSWGWEKHSSPFLQLPTQSSSVTN